MDPHDFLDLANDLANGMSEAEWRSAVSRAYYASYHIARRLLLECGFAVPQADQDHAYLWLRLSNCGHPELQRAGLKLNGLRSKRNRADYNLISSWDHVEAVSQLEVALEITELLDEAVSLPEVRSRITAAIQQYETTVLKQTTWKPPPP